MKRKKIYLKVPFEIPVGTKSQESASVDYIKFKLKGDTDYNFDAIKNYNVMYEQVGKITQIKPSKP